MSFFKSPANYQEASFYKYAGGCLPERRDPLGYFKARFWAQFYSDFQNILTMNSVPSLKGVFCQDLNQKVAITEWWNFGLGMGALHCNWIWIHETSTGYMHMFH